ncbi:MAG: PA14 domain-containing protein [Planctomycetota bacterium]
MPKDSFSVRWEGFVVPPRTGRYTFAVRSDDGTRMWVAGAKVLEDWTARSVATTRGRVMNLESGKAYPVKLEYFENSSGALVSLLWTGPGILTLTPVPPECLRPPQNYRALPGPPTRE